MYPRKNMTKQQYQRWSRIRQSLEAFTAEELIALRRCEMTLQRWAEHECNGFIQRDEETGKPFTVWYTSHLQDFHKAPIADREKGALERIARIVSQHEGYSFYYQQDCRGCMLYIIRPGDIPAGERVGCYYTRGVAICI